MRFNVRIDRHRCKGCALCVAVCPRKILGISKTLNRKGYHHAEVLKPEECVGCGQCAVICPDCAIEIDAASGGTEDASSREPGAKREKG
ncbi:ferredoxin family protein [Verrucomicrobiota bacterium]